MGFDVPAGATPNEMVVALRLADDADGTLAGGRWPPSTTALRAPARRDAGAGEVAPPRTTGERPARATPAALVLVSVPGASALVEAMDALDAGRDVMVFSDNVPVEQEVALKRAAAERGAARDGPDCGTAVVGGLGLGFANAVAPGPVGIVAASGTGCQQLLACSTTPGVGVAPRPGRRRSRPVAPRWAGSPPGTPCAASTRTPAVELIVLVSKPPAAEVAAEHRGVRRRRSTPRSSSRLLGPGRPDLTAAAESVLRRLGARVPAWPVRRPAHPRARGAVTCAGSSSAARCATRRCWSPAPPSGRSAATSRSRPSSRSPSPT